jgi:hypothetical protein
VRGRPSEPLRTFDGVDAVLVQDCLASEHVAADNPGMRLATR